MSSYKLITGNLEEIESFEEEVSEALEEGYELSGNIKVKEVNNTVMFFQSLVYDDLLEFNEEELIESANEIMD